MRDPLVGAALAGVPITEGQEDGWPGPGHHLHVGGWIHMNLDDWVTSGNKQMILEDATLLGDNCPLFSWFFSPIT